MNREEYIRDLAYHLLVSGPSARWETAGEDEREEAKLLIDKLLGSILVPDPPAIDVQPDDEYTAMAEAIKVFGVSLSH